VAHKGSAEGRGVSSARFSTLCSRGQTLTLPSDDFFTRETALIQRMECANGFPPTTALAAHRVRRRHNLHQAVQAAGCSQPNPGRFWGLAEEARHIWLRVGSTWITHTWQAGPLRYGQRLLDTCPPPPLSRLHYVLADAIMFVEKICMFQDGWTAHRQQMRDC
jgi:hypothetical protein